MKTDLIAAEKFLEKASIDLKLNLPIEEIKKLADYMVEKIVNEQTIKQRICSIETCLKDLEREKIVLLQEKENLQKSCPHLTTNNLTDNGEGVCYSCGLKITETKT